LRLHHAPLPSGCPSPHWVSLRLQFSAILLVTLGMIPPGRYPHAQISLYEPYLASLEFHWTPISPPPPSAFVVIHHSHLELAGMVKRGGLGSLARTYRSKPAIHTISVAFRLSRPDRSFKKFKMSVLLQLVWAAAR
jgi:hypothetical protein